MRDDIKDIYAINKIYYKLIELTKERLSRRFGECKTKLAFVLRRHLLEIIKYYYMDTIIIQKHLISYESDFSRE